MSAVAKIFVHGRSQAVRLPKAFRFTGTDVRVTRVGDRVILEPNDPSPDPDALWAAVDSVGDADFMAEGRDQPSMPADRVTFD
jgi:antitoxin VapB